MKILNDAFYTVPKIAKKCLGLILNLKSYDSIIEPSAGNGSFSKLIKCFAYDLEPKSSSIIKQDFLQLDKQKQWGDKTIFLGNPPFGERSMLAKKFIKHSINLNATTIAFILPNVFSKTTNQKYTLFPKDWKMITEYKLPRDSFFIIKNNKKQIYHVPCTFYIWTKDKTNQQKNLRRWPPKKKPTEFSFVKRGSMDADFVLNGNSGKIKGLSEITNPKSEHYIKVHDESKISFVKKIMSLLKFKNYSSVNGGNFWINQDEIIIAWNRQSRHIMNKGI